VQSQGVPETLLYALSHAGHQQLDHSFQDDNDLKGSGPEFRLAHVGKGSWRHSLRFRQS
jgi:hypothetical protein